MSHYSSHPQSFCHCRVGCYPFVVLQREQAACVLAGISAVALISLLALICSVFVHHFSSSQVLVMFVCRDVHITAVDHYKCDVLAENTPARECWG